MAVIGSFRDMNDFLVEIGTIVGYTEFFATDDIAGIASYRVTDLPNYGDMVEMVRVVWNDANGTWVDEEGVSPIHVEPYKIGAI